ncbi:hypothetical protein WKH56_20590 [Priestia sp. SB1]|uniref:hypothetical protein n=1 Tax=Priestia sp. SB1 TaxID=3132359 RepID=UPI00317F32E1
MKKLLAVLTLIAMAFTFNVSTSQAEENNVYVVKSVDSNYIATAQLVSNVKAEVIKFKVKANVSKGDLVTVEYDKEIINIVKYRKLSDTVKEMYLKNRDNVKIIQDIINKSN